MKTKFSLTIYGNNVYDIEEYAISELGSYFGKSPAEYSDIEESMDIELLVQSRDLEDKNSDMRFKATIYASVKRNAVNFAK